MLFSSLYWKSLDCFSIGHCSCSASSTFTSVNVLLNAVTLQRGTRCKALCLHQTLHFTLKRIRMYIFHIDHSPILGMKSLNSLCVCHSCCVITIIGRKGHYSTNTLWTQTISVIASIYREQSMHSLILPAFLWNNIAFLFNWNMPLKTLCVSQWFWSFKQQEAEYKAIKPVS